MGKKENRPDACTASGTASTCDYDSTFVSAGQDMTENELIRKVTEEYTDNPVFVPDEMRAQPEPLIAEYEVTEWMNKAYRGSDQSRVCMPDLPARVRGLVRTVPLGSGGSNETDSEDKEE